MNRLLLSLALIAFFTPGCKKEMESLKQTPSANNREITTNSIPPICFGNEWDYDHVFYPAWFYEDAGLASDMQPLVYNNKVYIPDYEDQEVRIFDGTNWTQVTSNVPIPTDYHNISFTIGSKGYLGRVFDGHKEFYQYNFITNTWIRKADCPFAGKYAPATFSIGTKGYLASGANSIDDVASRELWEYNSSTNVWTRKADLPVGLYEMSFFAVGGKGYVVNGRKSSNVYNSALYQYDPTSDSWSTKAFFPGEKRIESISFVIGDKAYSGGGKGLVSNTLKDYYKYDPANNSWTRIKDMSLDFMRGTVYGFSINSRGYAVYHHTVSDDLYTVKYTPLICTE